MKTEKREAASISSTLIWATGLMSLWLLLSGYFEPLPIGLGVLSCLLVLTLKHRIYKYDRDPAPIKLDPIPLTKYWVWLIKEVIVANIDVAKRVLARDMPINPSISKVSSGELNDFGKVVYANSITLTPGTISIDVGDDDITVHALSHESLVSLEQGSMRKRIEKCKNATLAVLKQRGSTPPQF